MTGYLLLLTLHIVLVGLWLGTDFGTFLAFRRMTSAALPLPARLEMGRLADLLDMGPRTALILLLMLGLTMTNLGGFGLPGAAGGTLAAAAAVLGILWLAGVWHQFWVLHPPSGGARPAAHVRFQRGFRRVDLGWRVLLAVAIVVAAVASLAGAGPIAARWLAVKLILFAGIIGLGFAIRLSLPKIGSALEAIAAGGSTPEREAALRAAARPTYPLVWSIWALVIVIAWLAVAKPL